MLADTDLPAVTELARECLSVDGGQPFAASVGYLSECYLGGAYTHAGFSGARLVCVSSVRSGEGKTTTGLLHPAWRRRGIGSSAFDWARDRAGGTGLVAETETLNAGAHALYLSKGLHQVLEEDVMQLAARATLPPAQPPAGLTLWEWGQADPARFYAVYYAAFRDRPAFRGMSQARWVEWIRGDEDFRAGWTLLAAVEDIDVGFIAGEATGWVAQLGVVPSARRAGIGAWLIGEVVGRMRAAGETVISLNVNVDNGAASALYRKLGFIRVGGRARYCADPPGQSHQS